MDKDDLPRPIGKPRDATFPLPKNYRHPSFHPHKEPLARKRSVGITLGVLGVAAIGFGWMGGKDVQRNSYNSLADCEQDYATGQCTSDRPVSGGGSAGYSGGSHYYGPWYRSDWRNGSFRGDPGPGRSYASGMGSSTHGPTGFDFGSRGGFGSSGRVSARGG
ncbi:MAG: hypothetical protein ABWX83_02715 [Luteibacter sp.]